MFFFIELLEWVEADVMFVKGLTRGWGVGEGGGCYMIMYSYLSMYLYKRAPRVEAGVVVSKSVGTVLALFREGEVGGRVAI